MIFCHRCQYEASSKEIMNIHRNSEHYNLKQSQSKAQLVQHQEEIHDGRKYQCKECSFKFLYRSKLTQHQRAVGDTYYPTIRHATADRWYSQVICTSDRFLVDKDQVHITRQNLNKIWRLASQSATSNWLEISSKARIPIEDIPAGWKTNLAKFIIKREVDVDNPEPYSCRLETRQ